MPSVKDLAREVIAANWPIGDIAFDALWESLAEKPLSLDKGHDAGTALAAASATNDAALIAIALVIRALQDLVHDTGLNELLPHIEALGAAVKKKGVAVAFGKTARSRYPSDTIITIPRPFATLHTHEYPNGKRIDEKAAQRERNQKAKYRIFVYHESNLPLLATGQMYATGPKKTSIDIAAHFTDLQYRIIRHLLKHRDRVEQRSIPALIEHAWLNSEAARSARRELKAEHVSSTYRTFLRRFSASTQELLAIQITLERSNIYTITPWPATYCVIEEQPADQDDATRLM